MIFLVEYRGIVKVILLQFLCCASSQIGRFLKPLFRRPFPPLGRSISTIFFRARTLFSEQNNLSSQERSYKINLRLLLESDMPLLTRGFIPLLPFRQGAFFKDYKALHPSVIFRNHPPPVVQSRFLAQQATDVLIGKAADFP